MSDMTKKFFKFRCVNHKEKLILSAQEGNVADCEKLLRDGVRVDNQTEESRQVGWTALLSASRRGHLDLVKLLLDHKADVNAKSTSFQTPLHGACWNGHLAVADLLLQRGAELNAQSNSGQTALHGAAWNGHAKVAKLLLERGAAVNARNKFGQTALHWAAHYAHVSVAEVLIRHGADLTAENDERETPLLKAKANPTKSAGRSAMIRLLQKSLTSKTFLAVLFSKKHDVKFHDWHARMAASIHNIQELKIYYTVLKFHLRLEMLTPPEANQLIEAALERTAVVAAKDGQQMTQFKHVVAKCLQDDLITDDVYNLYDACQEEDEQEGIEAIGDVDDGSFSLLSLSTNGKPESVKDMRTAIKRNSIRISGLDGSYRSLQQNFQIYCRKILMLQDDAILEHEPSVTSPGSKSLSSLNRYPSAYRAKKLKTKIEATLGLVGVILNAIVMSYESSYLSKEFEGLCQAMVDFGDPEHMQGCIQEESVKRSKEGDVDTFSASYKASFEMGMKLAAEVLAPEKQQTSNQHIDEALRARDPLFVLGLAATMANPRVLKNNSEKQAKDAFAAKQKELQESLRGSPVAKQEEEALNLANQAYATMSDLGRQAFENVSAFVRPSLESSNSGFLFEQSPQLPDGPNRATSPHRPMSTRLTAPAPGAGFSMQASRLASPYPSSPNPHHRLASVSALPPATKSPETNRSTTPSNMVPLPASLHVSTAPLSDTVSQEPRPPTPNTPNSQYGYENPFAMPQQQQQQGTGQMSLQYDPSPSSSRLLTPASERSRESPTERPISSVPTMTSYSQPSSPLRRSPLTLSPRPTRPQLQQSLPTLSPGLSHSQLMQQQGTERSMDPLEIQPVINVRVEDMSQSLSYASLQSTITDQFRDSILPIEDEGRLDLHAAVKYGDRDLLEELVKQSNGNKSVINELDSKGRTPADLAALTGQLDLMNFLIQESGASFAFKSGARMRAIARRRAPFVNQYHEMVESDLEEA